MSQRTPAATHSSGPVTLSDMRREGVHTLLVYCDRLDCHHSATLNADRWPGDVPVPAFCSHMVCTVCGHCGADVRPNWSEGQDNRGWGAAHRR